MLLKNRIIGLAAVGAAAAALTVVPSAVAKAPAVELRRARRADSPPEGLRPVPARGRRDVRERRRRVGAGRLRAGGAGRRRRPRRRRPLRPRARPRRLGGEPPICVTEDSESFRFLSNVVTGGLKDENLQVDVIYLRKKAHEFRLKVNGNRSAPVGKLKLSTGEFKQDATVRLRFSAINGATVRIDDVYMDPRLH